MVSALTEALHPVAPADEEADREFVSDAGLVAAELLSNAVRACRSEVAVRLEIHHRYIRIAVYDDGAGGPAPRAARDHETCGRGLAIVAALSADWGTTVTGAGKYVWSELRLPTASSTHLPCSRHRVPVAQVG